MSVYKLIITLMVLCLSVTMTGCGGGGGSSGDEPPQQSNGQDTENPTAGSEKANIELYGEFDAGKTKEVGSDNAALLLDDEDVEYSALGMSLPEKKVAEKLARVAEVDEDVFAVQAEDTLEVIKVMLSNDGASVTELVNRMSAGLLGRVAVVVLSADYDATTTSASAIRNAMIDVLGSDAEVAELPQTGTLSFSKFRIALAIVETDVQPLVWAAAYPVEKAGVVTSAYGDLNNGSAVVTNGTQDALENNQETFSQTENSSTGVDILWVIDNSGSMSQEQQNLADGVDQFFDQLNNAGVDFRLAATTTDARNCEEMRPLPDNATANFIDSTTAEGKAQWSGVSGIARPGIGGSGTETGFFCADKVDTSGFDRADADDVVVFVSDEPENETATGSRPSGQNSYVVRDFNTYKQSFIDSGATFFAIVGEHKQVRATFNDSYGFSTSCNGDGGNAYGGSHYREIATETGGSSASICSDSADWSVMYNEIIETATGLASNFILAHQALPSSVVVEINGAAVVRDTAHENGFDVIRVKDNTALAFYGAAIPEDGDSIEVSYDYQPASP